MKKEVLEFVTKQTHALIEAPTCCAEAKDAAKTWLASVGTDREAEETRRYLAQLEADIVTADGLAAFAESEAGKKVFGDEAPNVAAHAREIKAAGAKYCDCPACTAVEAILEKKEELLS